MRRCAFVILACVAAGASAGCMAHRDPRVTELRLDDIPDGLAVGEDRVWVAVPGSHRAVPAPEGWLYEVDPSTAQVVSRVRVGRGPESVVWTPGAVWVLNRADASIMRIDPARHAVTQVIPYPPRIYDLHTSESALWVLTTGGLARIDLAAPGQPAVTTEIDGPWWLNRALAVDQGAVWLLVGPRVGGSQATGGVARVHKLDPATLRTVATVEVDRHALDLEVGFGSVWVLNQRLAKTETVTRIDGDTLAIVATIPIRPQGWFLAACGDGVWVSHLDDLSRIDPATNRVAEVLGVPDVTRKLACGRGVLWGTHEEPDHGSLVRVGRRDSAP